MSPIQSNLAEQQLPQEVEHTVGRPVAEPPALAVVASIPKPVQSVSLRRRVLAVAALGAVSAALYALLFAYADQISAMSAAARSGAKYYALVPIVIALIFSFVHGAFTGRFWDVLGLKARGH